MSIISPSTPSGHSVFCDDVRTETNGKQILIGVYNADMLVDSFPILLPTFCIIIRYQERKDESDLPVKFVVTAPNPDDEMIFEADVPRDALKQAPTPSDAPDDPMTAINLNTSFAGFVISHPGRIKVRAYRGDDEIRLGTLRIRLRSEWDEEQRKIAETKKEAAN
jgi:hypothetical protein